VILDKQYLSIKEIRRKKEQSNRFTKEWPPDVWQAEEEIKTNDCEVSDTRE